MVFVKLDAIVLDKGIAQSYVSKLVGVSSYSFYGGMCSNLLVVSRLAKRTHMCCIFTR